jgi:hypothetical protein
LSYLNSGVSRFEEGVAMFEIVATINSLLSKSLAFSFLKKYIKFFVSASLLLKLNSRQSIPKKYQHY